MTLPHSTNGELIKQYYQAGTESIFWSSGKFLDLNKPPAEKQWCFQTGNIFPPQGSALFLTVQLSLLRMTKLEEKHIY